MDDDYDADNIRRILVLLFRRVFGLYDNEQRLFACYDFDYE